MPATAEAWAALERHHSEVAGVHLRDLFAADPTRGERLVAEAAGITMDYSKNRVNDETLTLLRGLADAAGLRARIDAMFAGEHINVTEDRAVGHVALRMPRDGEFVVDGGERRPRGPRGPGPDGGVLRARAVRGSGSGTPASRSAPS